MGAFMVKKRAKFFRLSYLIGFLIPIVFSSAHSIHAQELDVVPEVEKQPLVAATQRLVTAMETAGSPFDENTIARSSKPIA